MPEQTSRSDEVEPTAPEEEGKEVETPELAQIEAARLLANSARSRLKKSGLTDDQIEEWAATFVAEEGGTADLDVFVDWIERHQS